jgi:hypothetical protein
MIGFGPLKDPYNLNQPGDGQEGHQVRPEKVEDCGGSQQAREPEDGWRIISHQSSFLV